MKKSFLKLIGISITTIFFTIINPVKVNAAWKNTGFGWCYTEGDKYAIGWRKIDNKWYYFKADGYMETGWRKIKGDRYYFNKKGQMITGWLQLKDGWYYMDNSGAMVTGWRSFNGNWYYFNKNGLMEYDGTKIIKDEKYYFLSSGIMAVGWVNVHGNVWVYAYPDGHLARNEIINGYYLNSLGEWYDII